MTTLTVHLPLSSAFWSPLRAMLFSGSPVQQHGEYCDANITYDGLEDFVEKVQGKECDLLHSGSSIAWHKFSSSYLHSALHPRRMFDKGDVDCGSGEPRACEDRNEFSDLAHRFLPATSSSSHEL